MNHPDNTVLTNTPRPGDTAEQIAARTAPRRLFIAPEVDAGKAALFYLTEPARGQFLVNFKISVSLYRIEITRDQLANFLVDGAAMALRDVTGRGS